MSQDRRPEYYEGEYLGADDLEAIVRYARVGQARHALGAHLWGIAEGLDLVERPLAGGDVEIVLTPGVAWDGHGRGLVALVPQRLSLDRFANFQDDTPPEGIPIEVWLTYRELPAAPPGVGFSCPEDDLHGRVVETFDVALRREPPASAPREAHFVSIASRSLDAREAVRTFDPARALLFDESVPQQAFPERGNAPFWPVFAGIVRWRKDPGVAGRLIARTDDDRNGGRRKRRYLGAVAETIAAADGVLRLRDRFKDPNDSNTNFRAPVVAGTAVNDLVWCEGHLRVVGDARLQPSAPGVEDGRLDFRVARGGDDDIPIRLRRTSVKAPIAKTTLDAFVAPPPPLPGPPAPPPAPPVVQPKFTDPQTRFTVSTTEGGKPKERLTVVTDGRVGVNAENPSNTLQVEGPSGIRYGFGYLTGDAGAAWAALAFNAYNWQPGGPWIIPDATHHSAALWLDDAGKVPQLKFQTNDTLDPADWTVHVIAKGDTGHVGIGIGDTPPAARLHVRSDNAAQGDVQVFSNTADFEYDGGGDHLFIFKAAHPDHTPVKTSFLGGDVGIGTADPKDRLHVFKDGHLNAVFDNGFNEHLSLVVGSLGSGLRFSDTNDFFVSSQPFANRADNTFGATEHLRIKPNGNVGIATAAPQARLHVVGDRIRLSSGAKRLDLRTDGGAVDLQSETDSLYIRSTGPGGKNNVIINALGGDGNVGVGTEFPTAKLEVSGDLRLNGDAFATLGGFWVVSDAGQKQDVRPIETPLDRLLALRGVHFAWRKKRAGAEERPRQTGFIAQEVEKVFPEFVTTTPWGDKAINMAGLDAVTVEAVRELAQTVRALQAEVAELRKRLGPDGPAPAAPAATGRRRPR